MKLFLLSFTVCNMPSNTALSDIIDSSCIACRVTEYGDPTDPMGNTYTNASMPNTAVHCHNAPYSWRLGWAGPIAGGDLTAGDFTPTRSRLILTIPAASVSDKNMVIVDLGTSASGKHQPAGNATIAYPRFYISYRVKNYTFGGYDGGLADAFNQKVLIHEYNSEVVPIMFDQNKTSVHAIRTMGKFWRSPFIMGTGGLGGGLQVRVLSVGPTSAQVEICRMYGLIEGIPGSEECQANLDRDWYV